MLSCSAAIATVTGQSSRSGAGPRIAAFGPLIWLAVAVTPRGGDAGEAIARHAGSVGAATVVEAKLSSWQSFLALLLYCLLASSSYLAMEIYAVARPGPSQELMARFRTRIDTHTDQVIIAGSLLIGLWLIANSLYLIVSQTGSS